MDTSFVENPVVITTVLLAVFGLNFVIFLQCSANVGTKHTSQDGNNTEPQTRSFVDSFIYVFRTFHFWSWAFPRRIPSRRGVLNKLISLIPPLMLACFLFLLMLISVHITDEYLNRDRIAVLDIANASVFALMYTVALTCAAMMLQLIIVRRMYPETLGPFTSDQKGPYSKRKKKRQRKIRSIEGESSVGSSSSSSTCISTTSSSSKDLGEDPGAYTVVNRPSAVSLEPSASSAALIGTSLERFGPSTASNTPSVSSNQPITSSDYFPSASSAAGSTSSNCPSTSDCTLVHSDAPSACVSNDSSGMSDDKKILESSSSPNLECGKGHSECPKEYPGGFREVQGAVRPSSSSDSSVDDGPVGGTRTLSPSELDIHRSASASSSKTAIKGEAQDACQASGSSTSTGSKTELTSKLSHQGNLIFMSALLKKAIQSLADGVLPLDESGDVSKDLLEAVESLCRPREDNMVDYWSLVDSLLRDLVLACPHMSCQQVVHLLSTVPANVITITEEMVIKCVQSLQEPPTPSEVSSCADLASFTTTDLQELKHTFKDMKDIAIDAMEPPAFSPVASRTASVVTIVPKCSSSNRPAKGGLPSSSDAALYRKSSPNVHKHRLNTISMPNVNRDRGSHQLLPNLMGPGTMSMGQGNHHICWYPHQAAEVPYTIPRSYAWHDLPKFAAEGKEYSGHVVIDMDEDEDNAPAGARPQGYWPIIMALFLTNVTLFAAIGCVAFGSELPTAAALNWLAVFAGAVLFHGVVLETCRAMAVAIVMTINRRPLPTEGPIEV